MLNYGAHVSTQVLRSRTLLLTHLGHTKMCTLDWGLCEQGGSNLSLAADVLSRKKFDLI